MRGFALVTMKRFFLEDAVPTLQVSPKVIQFVIAFECALVWLISAVPPDRREL